MLTLVENSSGYAIFRLSKDIEGIGNFFETFSDPKKVKDLLKLEKFVKFKDTKEGLLEKLNIVDAKVSKKLKKLIKKLKIVEMGESLMVTDNKLGRSLHESLGVSVVCNSNSIKLRNLIFEHFNTLTGISPDDSVRLSLGLSHSYNRYKLKFNPDKLDTMVVQSIALLDDTDKELNNYVMRCKEMYGWHFPELAKTVTDNMMYVDLVMLIGVKDNALTMNLASVMPEELEVTVKDLARTSCGNQITDDDLKQILQLCNVIKRMQKSRTELSEYLTKRMSAIAPNLTAMLGETLGARLIAHAGTLMSLAKYPSSTVQILGAEKALFRSLKTGEKTPKYGLLYHASIIGQTATEHKGSAARLLANSVALCARKDAFDEAEDGVKPDLGVKLRVKLESNMRARQSGHHKAALNKRKAEKDTNGGNVAKRRKFD